MSEYACKHVFYCFSSQVYFWSVSLETGIGRSFTKLSIILPTPFPFQFSKLVILSIHLNWFYPRLLVFFAKFNFSNPNWLFFTTNALFKCKSYPPLFKIFQWLPFAFRINTQISSQHGQTQISPDSFHWSFTSPVGHVCFLIQSFCTFSFTHFYICLSLSVNTTKTMGQ